MNTMLIWITGAHLNMQYDVDDMLMNVFNPILHTQDY